MSDYEDDFESYSYGGDEWSGEGEGGGGGGGHDPRYPLLTEGLLLPAAAMATGAIAGAAVGGCK